jgi:hypothetical protein
MSRGTEDASLAALFSKAADNVDHICLARFPRQLRLVDRVHADDGRLKRLECSLPNRRKQLGEFAQERQLGVSAQLHDDLKQKYRTCSDNMKSQMPTPRCRH